MYTVTFVSSCGTENTTRQELEATLQMYLHMLTQANALCMARRRFVPVYDAGWKLRHDFGKWQDVAQVLATGYASLHDVAAWRAAELRKQGIAAKAKMFYTIFPTYECIVEYPATTPLRLIPKMARGLGNGLIHESPIEVLGFKSVLPRVQLPLRAAFVSSLFAADGHNRQESHATLQLYLDGLTLANDILLANRNLPSIYDDGVRYQAEPAGVEDWYDKLGVHKRKRNDCEDLSAARTSELRKAGARQARSVFKFWQNPDTLEQRYHCISKFAVPVGGRLRFHPSAQMQPDGFYIEDPSKVLGMRGAS